MEAPLTKLIMSVNASFQAIPSALYNKIKERIPLGKTDDIELLYPSDEDSESFEESELMEVGFRDWWIFHLAFSTLGPPLLYAIQGDITFSAGINTNPEEEPFQGDHYIGYISSENVQKIAAAIMNFTYLQLQNIVNESQKFPSLQRDLETLQEFYKKAAELGMAVMITIA